MKRSIRDKAKGTFHEVKGKVKERIGRATTIPNWKPGARSKRRVGRPKRKSANWRKPSENSRYGSVWRRSEPYQIIRVLLLIISHLAWEIGLTLINASALLAAYKGTSVGSRSTPSLGAA